jgi:hypothetical protein
MNKNLLKKIEQYAQFASLLALINTKAQTHREFRKSSIYNASYISTSDWQIFNKATDWKNTSLFLGAGSIVTFRDGVVMYSSFGRTNTPSPPSILWSILNSASAFLLLHSIKSY